MPLVEPNVHFSVPKLFQLQMDLGQLVDPIAKCVTGSVPEIEDSPQTSELEGPAREREKGACVCVCVCACVHVYLSSFQVLVYTHLVDSLHLVRYY